MGCYALDSTGTSHEVNNNVLQSDGTSVEISIYVLQSDGTSVQVCVVTQLNAGGEDPNDKRKRYNMIHAKQEEKLLIMVVKAYLKHTI